VAGGCVGLRVGGVDAVIEHRFLVLAILLHRLFVALTIAQMLAHGLAFVHNTSVGL
jgi:hypothetical protein